MQRLKSLLGRSYRLAKFIRDYVQARPYLQYLLVFSFFVLVFQWMYISVAPLISGDDHYFHFRFAQLMTERGFFPMFNNFKNVYFSPMASGRYYATYNFLFYVVIIPLTYIQPLYLAIKLYAVIAGALAFTLFYMCCKWYEVKRPFFWTVAIIALMGMTSLWHLFLSRPYVLAPMLLLVMLFALKNKQYWLIFSISFIYFFWHNATFWFPLLIAVVYFVFEKFYGLKTNIKNVIVCFCGIVVAIIMVSIFGHGFITYQLDGIFSIFLSSLHHSTFFIPEGGELFPINFFVYITSNTLIFSIFAIAICFEIAEYAYFRRNVLYHVDNVDTNVVSKLPLKMTTFFISILFFFGTIAISGRFNDYFIFFVSFYVVLAISSLLDNVSLSTQRMYRSVMVGMMIVVISLFTNSILQIQNTIANNGSPAEVFAGVGDWLKNNTQKGDIIFNPNWSWFPQLYYYSPDSYYIAGMEPRVFYNTNQKLYWEWLNIGYRGYSCDHEFCPELEGKRESMLKASSTASMWYKAAGDDISKTLLNDFKSSYVIGSQYEMPRMNEVMDNNSHFKKVYGEGKAYFIYKVLP
jgi:hypothetical protein